jgi:hypothetical protein
MKKTNMSIAFATVMTRLKARLRRLFNPWSVIEHLEVELRAAKSMYRDASAASQHWRKRFNECNRQWEEICLETTNERDRLIGSNEGLKKLVGDLQQLLSRRRY